MARDDKQASGSGYRTRAGRRLLAIAGLFLPTEHRVHGFGALPFVLCPPLHLSGHRGGGHGGHEPLKGAHP